MPQSRASRRNYLIPGAALLVAVLLGLVLLGGQAGVAGSTLSLAPAGWLGAAALLESWGVAVERWDRPLAELEATEAALVVVYPWQSLAPVDSGELQHLRAGGELFVGYTGQVLTALGLSLLDDLEISWTEEEPGRLDPVGWWQERRQPMLLQPSSESELDPGLRIACERRQWWPRPTGGAQLWFADEHGHQGVWSFEPPQGGRVTLIPAEVFSNALIGEADNSALLRTLLAGFDRVVFDEFHHGLSADIEASGLRVGRVTDAFSVHLGLIYVLAAIGLAIPFGRAWPRRQVVSGSHKTLLVSVGRLHDRLGHHATAARKLVERFSHFDDHRASSVELTGQIDRQRFLELARQLVLPRQIETEHRRGADERRGEDTKR